MENTLQTFEQKLITELMPIRWRITGTLSFKDSWMRHRDNSQKRFEKGHWLMTRLGQILNVPRNKLGYMFKDELSCGIDVEDSTTGHLHFLLSERHIERIDYIKNILSGLWHGPKVKLPRFGLCSIKDFNSSKTFEGISYTVKTKKFRKIVFNDLYFSTSLEKEINFHKK